MKENQGK